ncbi:MAG: efflux RND transporter periplasmic adaptor subunit [Xanthobacteraceae bacterium]
MLTRNKNLVVLAVLTSGIALTAADSAPRSRADELHPAAAQAPATQGSTAQGSTAQGSTAQGSAAQGAAAQGSSTQGSWDAVTLGRIEPRAGEIKITAPLPGGRIAEVLVKPNEEVFAGELLVRLDGEEALARVAEADAQVALHKRARNDQSAPAASADRRKAEDAAADAERNVADARSALDKTTADWRAGRVARADLDTSRSALTRAEDRLRERREALAKLKASADTPLPTRLEGELNVAQAEWRVAQAALEKTQVRAPADGVVLRVDAKNGELSVPAAGPPILAIGDVSALRVRAEVNEQDLGRIRVGQNVLVRAGAFHGREFEGKVSSVARVVGPSRINSGDPRKFSDVDVLEVLVDLPSPGPLVVGEQVDVYFKSDRSDQVETQ